MGSLQLRRRSNLCDQVFPDMKDVERGGGHLFGHIIIYTRIEALDPSSTRLRCVSARTGRLGFFEPQVAQPADSIRFRQGSGRGLQRRNRHRWPPSVPARHRQNVDRVVFGLKALAHEPGQRFIIFLSAPKFLLKLSPILETTDLGVVAVLAAVERF
jgi:hypothetical protein